MLLACGQADSQGNRALKIHIRSCSISNQVDFTGDVPIIRWPKHKIAKWGSLVMQHAEITSKVVQRASCVGDATCRGHCATVARGGSPRI